jgi:argininosuccinate lyase
METLADALPKEIERVQEIIKEYEQVPMGYLAAALMKQDIKNAHEAMISGDIVGMLNGYQALKEWKM